MKIQLYWLLSAALLLLPGKVDAANNKKPFVIPELQEWRGSQGMFTLQRPPGSCIPEKIRPSSV